MHTVVKLGNKTVTSLDDNTERSRFPLFQKQIAKKNTMICNSNLKCFSFMASEKHLCWWRNGRNCGGWVVPIACKKNLNGLLCRHSVQVHRRQNLEWTKTGHNHIHNLGFHIAHENTLRVQPACLPKCGNTISFTPSAHWVEWSDYGQWFVCSQAKRKRCEWHWHHQHNSRFLKSHCCIHHWQG